MFCLNQIQTIKESNIYLPETAKAGSQKSTNGLELAEKLALIEPVMTVMNVMKADESDEYLKNSLGFTNSNIFQHF